MKNRTGDKHQPANQERGRAFLLSPLILLVSGSIPFTFAHPPHQKLHSEERADPERADQGARTPRTDHADHADHETNSMMKTMTGGPFRSMFALGSGTARQPALSPMAAWRSMPGEWMVIRTAQFSYGKLKNPEAIHAGDVIRQTASVTYSYALRQNVNSAANELRSLSVFLRVRPGDLK
jgi:hypothetical protein